MYFIIMMCLFIFSCAQPEETKSRYRPYQPKSKHALANQPSSQTDKDFLNPKNAPPGCRLDYEVGKFICINGDIIDPTTMEKEGKIKKKEHFKYDPNSTVKHDECLDDFLPANYSHLKSHNDGFVFCSIQSDFKDPVTGYPLSTLSYSLLPETISMRDVVRAEMDVHTSSGYRFVRDEVTSTSVLLFFSNEIRRSHALSLIIRVEGFLLVGGVTYRGDFMEFKSYYSIWSEWVLHNLK